MYVWIVLPTFKWNGKAIFNLEKHLTGYEVSSTPPRIVDALDLIHIGTNFYKNYFELF